MHFSPDFSKCENVRISADIDEALQDLRTALGNTMDLNIMNVKINNVKCAVITIESMASTQAMSELIFHPIMDSKAFVKKPEDLFDFLTKGSLMSSERDTVYTYGDLIWRIFSGFCAIITDTIGAAVVLGVQGFETRSISTPESEQTIKGSQDSFTETVRKNMSLVRRRLKTPSLRFEMTQIGEKTKTDVCMMYLADRADKQIVDKIRSRLGSIKLDTVLSGGYIEPFVDISYSRSFFSEVTGTERPDMAVNRLNEGKVGILVDGTPFCIICPSLFVENFQTMDDFCEKIPYAAFSRWLRYISFFLAIAFPGLYVAMVMFHPEVFTMKLLLNLSVSEEATPYPIVIEIIMLMVMFEIIREAGLRMPKAVGSSVSIVGGLIIGDAAVKSGLVSAPLLIVVGITATASLVIPSLYQPVALLRLIFILIGGVSGLFGLCIASIVLAANINAMNDYGISYTAPVTPFYKSGILDVISRRSFKTLQKTHSTVKQYKQED